MPLYEVFYISDRSKLMVNAFHPMPRTFLQTALAHTEGYLGCKCCAELPTTDNEDTSIIYRLYLECGRMINLFDLFSAFSSISNNADEAQYTYIDAGLDL